MHSYVYDNKRAKFIATQSYDSIESPLLINWNIIGECCNSCVYCYGYDIRIHKRELSGQELDEMLCHLKKMHPTVVVITGGEPLMCDNIFYIVERISKFSNVILDTNALFLTEKEILKLKAENIHLRISLDSDVPNVNESVRRSAIENSTEKIKKAIQRCALAGLDFTVQTVVSSANAESIPSLFMFLRKAGVKNWRLLDVVTDKSCQNLSLLPQAEALVRQRVEELKQKAPDMFITYVNEKNAKGNNVILINPKGQYLYRPAGCAEKQFVCSERPEKPTLKELMEKLDVKAHIRRYVIFEEE